MYIIQSRSKVVGIKPRTGLAGWDWFSCSFLLSCFPNLNWHFEFNLRRCLKNQWSSNHWHENWTLVLFLGSFFFQVYSTRWWWHASHANTHARTHTLTHVIHLLYTHTHIYTHTHTHAHTYTRTHSTHDTLFNAVPNSISLFWGGGNFSMQKIVRADDTIDRAAEWFLLR